MALGVQILVIIAKTQAIFSFVSLEMGRLSREKRGSAMQ